MADIVDFVEGLKQQHHRQLAELKARAPQAKLASAKRVGDDTYVLVFDTEDGREIGVTLDTLGLVEMVNLAVTAINRNLGGFCKDIGA